MSLLRRPSNERTTPPLAAILIHELGIIIRTIVRHLCTEVRSRSGRSRCYRCAMTHQDRKRNLCLYTPLKARGTCLKPLRVVKIDWQPWQRRAVFANGFGVGDALECTVSPRRVEAGWMRLYRGPYLGYRRVQRTYINTPDGLEARVRAQVLQVVVSLVIASTQSAQGVKQ